MAFEALLNKVPNQNPYEIYLHTQLHGPYPFGSGVGETLRERGLDRARPRAADGTGGERGRGRIQLR